MVCFGSFLHSVLAVMTLVLTLQCKKPRHSCPWFCWRRFGVKLWATSAAWRRTTAGFSKDRGRLCESLDRLESFYFYRSCRFAGRLEGRPNPQFIQSTSAFKQSSKESASSTDFTKLHWFNVPQLISVRPQRCFSSCQLCWLRRLHYRDIIQTQ